MSAGIGLSELGAIESIFTPRNIAGLSLWLDASQIAGLSGTDSLATWPDLSGNGNDAVQSTEGFKPTYQTDVINGLPVVRFDGTDDYLSATDSASLQPADLTIFIVSNFSSLKEGDQKFFAKSRNSESAAGATWQTTIYEANDLLYQTKNAGSWQSVAANDYIYTGAYITTITHNQSTEAVNIYKDGSAFSTSSSITQAFDYATDPLYIGARINGSTIEHHLQGDIAEMIIYDSALSTVGRGKVETYLADKYGITI